MLWTLKRTSFFWITVILLSQSHSLFVSSTSSSSDSSESSKSTSVAESSSSSSSSSSSPTTVNETAVSASSFSLQGIKDFIFKARGVDLARTFSSLRGSISTPFTALMYMGSLAIGAVVMLAFYESPISPLPVPPLPDPPVGRFPPENPVWPPPGRSSIPMGHPPAHLAQAASAPHPMAGPLAASGSDIHQVAVRPPAGYIHRRNGFENTIGQGPLKGQKQLNPLNSVRPKPPTVKVNKAPVQGPQQTSPPMANEKVLEVNNNVNPNSNALPNNNNNQANQMDIPNAVFPGSYNGTLNESGGSINSTVSFLASLIKDKPQKLFDILMPRTADNSVNKQN